MRWAGSEVTTDPVQTNFHAKIVCPSSCSSFPCCAPSVCLSLRSSYLVLLHGHSLALSGLFGVPMFRRYQRGLRPLWIEVTATVREGAGRPKTDGIPEALPGTILLL